VNGRLPNRLDRAGDIVVSIGGLPRERLDSLATTAILCPLPPARPASIVAFSAAVGIGPCDGPGSGPGPRRSSASKKHELIDMARFGSPSDAFWEIEVDWVTCREISMIEDVALPPEAATAGPLNVEACLLRGSSDFRALPKDRVLRHLRHR